MNDDEQDLAAHQNALEHLGVRPNLTYTDHGLTGSNRTRRGLREALAACPDGDTLVVAKLDRLARSLRDAKDIVDELTAKDVKLSIGGSIHDPTIPSAGYCSTCSRWSPNSAPPRSAPERKKAWPLPGRGADSRASNPSSPPPSNDT